MEIVFQERHGVPFYACTDPRWCGAPHGFSTRLGGVSPAPWDSLNLGAGRGDDPARVGENFRRFCRAVGTDADALVKNRQVPGTTIRSVTRADVLSDPSLPGEFPADGLVTDQPGVCLTIFSGDCIPILLYDPIRRVIAAVHAGWRGCAGGILAKTVRAMTENCGTDPADLLAAIGPCIGPCCFETDDDVPAAMRAALGADAEPCLRYQAPKWHVDLSGLNRQWLLRAGLLPEHIERSELCTACRPDLFWSHRKMGERRGVQAAMIALPGREDA